MNKGELVEFVAKKTKMPKSHVSEVLNLAFETIAAKAKKEPVVLIGLGTFKPVKRKARNGVNPATGQKIKIPAYKTVKFSPSAGIKKF